MPSKVGVCGRHRSSTVGAVNLATASRVARARLGSWPNEPDVGHLVLVDHAMVPSASDVETWLDTLRGRGLRAVRTGALFPGSTEAFRNAGFEPIDRLVLLRSDLASTTTPTPRRRQRATTRRLVRRRFDDAAAVDQRAFGQRWGNDASSLDDVCRATPHHRNRSITNGGRLVGFAISGRAGDRGYLQRLAVDPSAHRQGHGRALVDDALAWMRRRDVKSALVNTAVDNDAAIALYESMGFVAEPDELVVLEVALRS
jgi:ribosomal protein S18 acetylase RimI-like enzyme